MLTKQSIEIISGRNKKIDATASHGYLEMPERRESKFDERCEMHLIVDGNLRVASCRVLLD